MYVQRLLAINMAAFAALGTLLLGLGEQNPILPVVAVVAATAAVWLTDILGVFRVSHRVTNIAVLLAVLASLRELCNIQGSVQAMAITNLLAYVMLILLFQEKDFRTWWHIALLSLLQVVAAATFFQGVWFAPLLLAYFFLGICAIALLFLHHERTHYHQRQHRPIIPREVRTVSDHLNINWRRLGKIVLATFVVGPVSLFLDYGEKDDKGRVRRRKPKDPGSGRWPLIHEEAEFTGSADSLGGRAGVGWEFYRHLAGMLPGTLIVAAMLFLLIPRFGRLDFTLPHFGNLALGSRSAAPLRIVGFSDTVRLGELGLLIEDPEEVMKVRFTRPDDETTYPMQGEIYLRGALLTHYDQGNWEFHGSGYSNGFSGPSMRSVGRTPRPGLVWQTIGIQPMDRNELFCVWPFVSVQRDRRIFVDKEHERLRRDNNCRTKQMIYSLGTYALVDGSQVPLTPSPGPINPRHLLDVPADDLPSLVARADEWIKESKLDRSQVVDRARYLESRLKLSGQFAYSLEGQARESGIDPIEDFVKNTPVGHCEYFATALTLMLRSQDIPARMVIGYVSNEYDMHGEYYRVRQMGAHAWVEAYIPPRSLPETIPYGLADADFSSGGWLRLDPTPATTANTSAIAALVDNVENWVEWIKSAWISYVVEMDSARQKAAVYDPLKKMTTQLKEGVINPQWWKNLWRGIRSLPGRLRALLAEAGWFSWIGASLLFGALGFGYVAYRLVRGATHLALWLLSRGQAQAGRRTRVVFYRRLESIMARRGLKRRPGQTQREFAAEAANRLAHGREDRTAEAALVVADAFYQVRFGGGHLDNPHRERVEQALRRLEQAATGREG